MPKSTYVKNVLKNFPDPEEREKPDQDISEARHLFATLGYQDLRKPFAPRNLSIIDARA